MESSLLLKQSGPERDDATAPYDVIFKGQMTVRQFIDYVVNLKEWGYIGIYNPAVDPFFGDPKCEYRYARLIGELPNEIMDCIITKASASGGWSRMDYILTI